MRDFPSCFGESGIQVADSSSSSSSSSTTSKTAQNLVTCVYQCKLKGSSSSSSSLTITVTWTKNLMGQGLSIGIDDSSRRCLCKVDIKPWLFSKRKGSKTLESSDDSSKIDLLWDLSNAKFGPGPEPLGGFHLAVMFAGEPVLILGDERKRTENNNNNNNANAAVFVAKREHVFGKRSYATRAQFCDRGRAHEVAIECDTGGSGEPGLVIRIDGKPVMTVKRLKWKFRGNGTILVDGLPVQVFWDVHSWLFGNSAANAVFMFQTSMTAEKNWAGRSVFEDRRDCRAEGLGFSLLLYAWKNE